VVVLYPGGGQPHWAMQLFVAVIDSKIAISVAALRMVDASRMKVASVKQRPLGQGFRN
jgi:hypothetical protein